MKIERLTRRSTIGSIVRKRLSDITNSQPLSKWVGMEEKQQPPVCDPTQDLINQLLKEKVTLMKLVEEKDKIIALSNNQMRRLKMHCQKLQIQNWHLAQSNSQMLAEVNLGREKMKSLQHEIVCKDALLKVKNLKFEIQADITDQIIGSQEPVKNSAEQNLKTASNYAKPDNHGNRRRTARSQTMVPSTTAVTSRQVAEKEKLENKRRCRRRNSARIKSQEKKPADKLFEIKDVTLSSTQQPDNPILEDGFSVSAGSSSVNIKKEESSDRGKNGRRSSLGRSPLLSKAAEKVQTCKEVPLIVKMRRKD